MSFLGSKTKVLLLGMVLLFCGVLVYACAEAPQQRTLGGGVAAGKRLPGKNCLDCHKKFSDKYMGMKNVHPNVKQGKCEDCHLRHGIIPKLILKKEGNEICYPCHSKEKIGLNKPNIHTVLKRGKCIYNPMPPRSHLKGRMKLFQCLKGKHRRNSS
jgi:predicted CXXCH cytochrome family protein